MLSFGADPDHVAIDRRLADRVDGGVVLGGRVVDGQSTGLLLALAGRIVGGQVR